MRVVDLTHPVSGDMPVYFPWHPATAIEQTANYAEHRCEVRRIAIGSHSGTHIDAPRHVFPGAPTMDQYDPSLWYCDAVVLDFTPRDPRKEIDETELHGLDIPEGAGVVLKTGWDVHFGSPDYYKTYPPLSNRGAEFLVERRIRVLAADTPFTLDVHFIMLRQGIPLVTNLNNTGSLSSGRITLIAAPMLIRGGDGAPARVFAVVP